MKNIILIGAGNLGCRHLQSMVQLQRPFSLQIIDPYKESLEKARTIVKTEQNAYLKKIAYLSSIAELTEEIDVAVIATNADVRLSVLEALLVQCSVKSMILEKIVFQSTSDFRLAMELLEKHKVGAWVNCSRRMFAFYQQLRSTLDEQQLDYSVHGGHWGMASNSVHFLDHFGFLSGSSDITIEHASFDTAPLDSKRAGFLEVTGALFASSNRGRCSLVSKRSSSAPALIRILGETHHYLISESKKQALVATAENQWQWSVQSFDVPYQSQLTKLNVESLLETNSCDLTPIAESYQQHCAFLNALQPHFELVTGNTLSHCPIT